MSYFTRTTGEKLESTGMTPTSRSLPALSSAVRYPRPFSTVISITNGTSLVMVAMWCSGLMIWMVSSCCTSTPRIDPASCFWMRIVFGWSDRFFTTRLLTFRMMSVTSSTTPVMLEISCITP